MSNYPNSVGLMVAVPLSGHCLVPQFTWAMMNLHPPMNFNMRYVNVMGREVGEARNWLAEQAVEQKSKYLFFIDEDVTPPGHALRQLIFQMEHHPEIDVIAGIYCHKSNPPMPMIFRGNGHGPYWDWKLGEFFEISGCSMGCTMIRTSVFEKLAKPWFKTVDDASPFLDAVNSAEQWTEDLYFCEKVRNINGKIYADAGIICEHWDTRVFPAKPVTLPPFSKPMLHAGVKRGEKKIIDLGAGESPYETAEGKVLTADIREEVKPDYRTDLRWLPFGNDEFDIVFSSHVLEHFSRDEVPKTLDEWVRILKPEGELRLVLPNIEWAAENVVKGIINDDVMNVIYGAQTYGENFHKFCFTPQVLEKLLNERGFKRQDYSMSGYNIYCRAWRIPPDEKEVPKLPEKTKVFGDATHGDKVEVKEPPKDLTPEVDKVLGLPTCNCGEGPYWHTPECPLYLLMTKDEVREAMKLPRVRNGDVDVSHKFLSPDEALEKHNAEVDAKESPKPYPDDRHVDL